MTHSYLVQQSSRICCRALALALVLCCLGAVSQAQYTHSLTNTMSTPQPGAAIAAAAIDETVFLLTDDGGLRALRPSDGRYTTEGYILLRDRPRVLAVGHDGMIYLGNDRGVLSAWVFAGSVFQQIAHVWCAHPINDVAVSDDGTVFVASGVEGIAAYRYDGGTLAETARINEGGDVRTVAVGRDGRVYAAGRAPSYVGVYEYSGTHFVRLGRHDGGQTMVNDLAVSEEGMILLADLVDGLFMFRFDGADILPLAHMPDAAPGNGVAILRNGQVCVANGNEGMRVYDIVGEELIPRARWNEVGNDARSVACGEHEFALLANGMDGLRALECVGAEVRCIAHQPVGEIAAGVAVGWDGTIFVANGLDGLVAYREESPILRSIARASGNGGPPSFARAVAVDGANRVYLAHGEELSVYGYTDGSFRLLAHAPAFGRATGIALDRWGRIYLACGESGLQVFQLIGSSLHAYAQVNDGGTVTDVAVTRTGTVFVTNGMDGLRAYVWSGPLLRAIAHINDGFGPPEGAFRLALAPDNTVFVAAGREGLRAYQFNGVSFIPTARLDFPFTPEATGVRALELGPDGTIFFGCNDVPGSEADGMYACRYNGSAFRITARAEHRNFVMDVAVAPDGMVFLADRRGGVLGYEYRFDGGPIPTLAVNPLSVDFGSVPVGGIARRYILLSNTGTGMLHIAGLQLITANVGEFSIVNPWPTELPAGASMRVCVQCTPRSTGAKGATLRIVSDDPEHPLFDVPMRASVGYTAPSPVQLPTITLGQNIPNPFNPSTEISFFLSQPEHVKLTVFDIVGRQIVILLDARTDAGSHTVRFDGSKLPSGMYMYRLEAGGSTMTRRMLLLN